MLAADSAVCRNFAIAAERCDTLPGLTEILSRGPLDLVLICQSVPDAECEEVIEMVRAASPEVKVLVMQAGQSGSCSVHSDAAMENLKGPPALLAEIRGMLGIVAPQSTHLA
jgi:hypothetical protein